METIKITKLKPHPQNARTHSKKQIRQIAQSIEEFGFTNPVLIDGKNNILAGHGRVEAAKLAGLAEVPCVRLSHLTLAQKRAYILADNRLAELSGVFTLLVQYSVPGSLHYEFMDWRHVGEILYAGRVYSELKNICVWNKLSGGMGSLYRFNGISRENRASPRQWTQIFRIDR